MFQLWLFLCGQDSVCNILHSVVDVFPLERSSSWTSQRFDRQQEQVLAAVLRGLLQTHESLEWHQPELGHDDRQCEGLSQQMAPPICNILILRFLSVSNQVFNNRARGFLLTRTGVSLLTVDDHFYQAIICKA